MEAGFELDRRIAKEVFGQEWPEDATYRVLREGWNMIRPERVSDNVWINAVLPHYSSDISRAWPLAVKYGLTLVPVRWFKTYDNWNHSNDDGDATWWAALHYETSMPGDEEEPQIDYVATIDENILREHVAPTAPLAICNAILRIIGS